MLRFLAKLFKIEYEPCKSCETLKMQLEYVNVEKKELLDTIMGLVNPKVIEKPPVEIGNIKARVTPWHVKKQQLQQEARMRGRIVLDNPEIKADIEKLEKELGLDEESNAKQDQVS